MHIHAFAWLNAMSLSQDLGPMAKLMTYNSQCTYHGLQVIISVMGPKSCDSDIAFDHANAYVCMCELGWYIVNIYITYLL